MQFSGAYTEAIHDAGCEIFDQNIGALDHLLEQVAALFRLEVECDWFFVGVQHRERQRGTTHIATATQMLAMKRLHLDHVRARHRHEKRRIGPVINV